VDFVADPAAELLHFLERDVAHVGDAEGLVLELAVAGAEDRVVLGLDGPGYAADAEGVLGASFKRKHALRQRGEVVPAVVEG